MKLTKDQTKALLRYVTNAKSDQIDCDGCFEHMAEFVEYELLGHEIPEALQLADHHMKQCVCCNDEHKALLEGLRVIEQS